MKNLNNYAENLGTRNIIIFVLMELKRKMKEDFKILKKKVQTLILKVYQKRRLFKDDKCCNQLKKEMIWEN